MQKIIESGIEQSYNFVVGLKPRDKKNSAGELSMKQLLSIVLFGWMFPFVAFTIEVLFKKLCVF